MHLIILGLTFCQNKTEENEHYNDELKRILSDLQVMVITL